VSGAPRDLVEHGAVVAAAKGGEYLTCSPHGVAGLLTADSGQLAPADWLSTISHLALLAP
jgi:hypothetical protein